MANFVRYGGPTYIAGYLDVESILGLSGNRFLQGSYARDFQDSGPRASQDIFVSTFTLRGERTGETWQVNTETWLDQTGVQFTALSGGKLLATWIDRSTLSKPDIRSQILTAEGRKDGPEVRISEVADGVGFALSRPSIATLKDGRSVISWVEREVDPQTPDRFLTVAKARIVDAEGNPVGAAFDAATTASPQPEFSTTLLESDVAALPGGGFVVSWSSFSGPDKIAIRSQAFDADGAKSGREAIVDVMDRDKGVRDPTVSVSVLTSGRYVVAWTDAKEGVKARVFNEDGTRAGGEIAADGTKIGRDATVLGLSDGSFVIGWTGEANGVFGRIFDAAGTARDYPFELGPKPPNPSQGTSRQDVGLSALPGGGFVATWHNVKLGEDVDDDEVRSTGVQVFLPSDLILETRGKTVTKSAAQFEAYDYIVTFNNPTDAKSAVSLRLVGDGALDLADELEGLRGATIRASDKGNTITTGAGDDTLIGGVAKDVLQGGAGDDRYYVNDAEDIVRDADGSDTVLASVDYSLARGERIEFLKASDAGSTAAIDLVGNAFAQRIEGNRGGNKLSGGAGDDTLDGGAGRDILEGGQGLDKFVFDSALGKGNVDLITDFSHKSDTILLGSGVFKGLGSGVLAEHQFKQIASAGSTKGVDKSDRILYDKADGDLYFDRDGSGGSYDRVRFAEVADNKYLESDDFLIV